MKPTHAHRYCPLALAAAAALTPLLGLSHAALAQTKRPAPAARAAAPAAEVNIADLGDDKLMGELSGRGMDTLLNRMFEVKQIPPERRSNVKALRALHELTDGSKLTPIEAQRRARVVGEGIAGVLPTMKDPKEMMRDASILLEAAVAPDVELLEFWGENPQVQAQLKPTADAAWMLLTKASELASKQSAEMGAKLTGANDPRGAQVEALDDLSRTAAYRANMISYNRALAIDNTSEAGKAARQKIADDTLKDLIEFDNNDSGVQPIVRKMIARLLAVKGEFKDGNTVYTSLITGQKTPLPDSATGGNAPAGGDEKKIVPDVSSDLQFDARYFTVVGLVEQKDAAGARKALTELEIWFGSSLDKNQQSTYGAAMDLIPYRISNLEASLAKSPDEKQKFMSQGDDALRKLRTDYPRFSGMIDQQLLSRLSPTQAVTSLNPLLLQGLMNRGMNESRKPTTEKVDVKMITQSIDAAKEVINRKDRTGIDAGMVEQAQALIPNMLSRLAQDSGLSPTDQIKYKVEAGNANLDYAQAKAKTDPARAKEGLEMAYTLTADLRKLSPMPPSVEELYDRFLPIAVEPPFNHKEMAYAYGKRLFRVMNKVKEAAVQFQQVPKGDRNYFNAQYYLMLCLDQALNSKLDAAERNKDLDQISTVADTVKQLGASSTDPTEKSRSAQAVLIGAQLAINEPKKKDPKHALALLDGFEAQVKGAPPDQQEALLVQALFARVNAYMALGDFTKATNTLVALLEKTEPGKAIGLVRQLLEQLDTAYVSADVNNDTDRMRTIATNEAQLTGSLAKWARESTNPKIKAFSYSYAVYDAKTKRIAGTLEQDPGKRKQNLTEALASYKNLQSPENQALYRATVGEAKIAAGQASATDIQVDVGIAFTEFELGDYVKAQEGLGALMGAKRLGSATTVVSDGLNGDEKVKDNDLYWEATWKLFKSNVEIGKQQKDASILNNMKRQLRQILIVGGIPERWQDEFESARKELIPDFQVPTAPTSQPAAPPKAPVASR